MSNFLGTNQALIHYVIAHTRESDIAKRLRLETQHLPAGRMQTMPDQVAFLSLLVKLIGARRIIEVGTFTGYSALGMAAAMPESGRLIACDTSKEWTDVAKRYWKDAGMDSRIELKIAPANETLAALAKDGQEGAFDLMFIDADKTGYDGYYEHGLKLVRRGGLIAFDNMLWGGSVADASEQDEDTKALRALNAKIVRDERADACLATIADGMMLARKR